jgi:hypothetical protein
LNGIISEGLAQAIPFNHRRSGNPQNRTDLTFCRIFNGVFALGWLRSLILTLILILTWTSTATAGPGSIGSRMGRTPIPGAGVSFRERGRCSSCSKSWRSTLSRNYWRRSGRRPHSSRRTGRRPHSTTWLQASFRTGRRAGFFSRPGRTRMLVTERAGPVPSGPRLHCCWGAGPAVGTLPGLRGARASIIPG